MARTRPLIACFALLLSFSTFAAHLVGGEITYECQGGNNYLVRVRVYRDCAGGGAPFDPTISIRVFNGTTGAFVSATPNTPVGTINQVPVNSGDPCLTIPAGLCTEYADYEAVITLPSSPDGYDITWQRCCRNGSIDNIPNSGSWGNTYTVRVPPNDVCGSSPQFAATPPIVICANEPLNIDASATDIDGDSLYYEFCEILHGGSSSNPSPVALPPPYQSIPFIAPQTFENPIPSSPQIKIDSLTGIIYGEASTQGQYVVGICVTSFSNGMLETTVRRDFQFNVSPCVRNVVSDMVTQMEDSSLFCSGRELQFTNESSNGNSYFWDFGDTTSLTDTSYAANPVFTYNAPGIYTVMLVTNPGTQCSDTVFEVFEIYESPELEWGIFQGSVCFNVQDIFFGALGNNIPPGATYEWYFGGTPAPNITYFNGPFPPGITWPVPGKYPVTVVMKSNTCTDSVIDTVEIVRFNQLVDAGPDQIVVEGDDVLMAASGGVQYYWYADNPVYFSDQRDPNTLTRPINDTTVYYVEVTTADGCQGIDSLTVIMVPKGWPNPNYSDLQNVITPNGDGSNDYLEIPEITDGRQVRFVLMNRWGSVVYQEDDYNGEWRGQDDGGNPLPDGTYYYIIQEGFEVIFTAPVTIIRNEN
ncbi:T9SS type B sorting domain-containing protein [Phaeocystidibacter luteus]|uniref:T9SS type B sorting domain-containing protein n=1 Tax=Phaeocystidibacter luteus TaxID=911197 RepID=A0A6N6RGV8_9FLAO|nr:gliding motility-associated C-terminal domain-containing protein [Phaeocystidibacter luteus]KAB2808146.1 T9SS type B sorting domain-containing protein [Phaeocystidibacter luteus]